MPQDCKVEDDRVFITLKVSVGSEWMNNNSVILMNLTREMNSPMRMRKMAQRKLIASYKTPPKVGPET